MAIILKHSPSAPLLRLRKLRDRGAGLIFEGGFELISGSVNQQTVSDDAIYDSYTSPVYHFNGAFSVFGLHNPSFVSLNPEVATIAPDGVITRVSSGFCRFLAKDGIILGKKLDLRDVSGQPSVDIYNSPTLDCLATHASDQVDSRINNTMTMNANGKVYTSQDHSTPSYTRNTNLWCSQGDAIDMTCISPWNSRGAHKRAGTAITPRHVLNAAHYPLYVGDTIRFVTNDNTVITRTITGANGQWVNNRDFRLYTLDSDLPATIKPCKVMPSNWRDYAVNNSLNRPAALGLDQEEKALIIDWRGEGRFLTPVDSDRLIFHENKISGDSGNPAFLIVNDELVLITCWTYGGAGSGTSVGDNVGHINTLISNADTEANISSGYTATEADFSGGRPNRSSQVCNFDGSNDRLDCSTNALVRRGNVVEFKVKVDYQVNQTTHIINTYHSSNSSTCFAPRLMVNHNNNQIRFYGCRGAPFPYWNIDSSFYGVWHTIKLRIHNTNGTLIYLSIDGGNEVSIDSNITTSPGDWGGNRNTYWSFGTGKNMELSDVKIFTTESDYNSNNPIIHHPLIEGSGTTAYDASGNGNHGTLVGGLPFTSSSDFPLINNTANRTGFTAGYKTSASSGRARWNAGTLPSFDVKKFKLKWYQPVEITSADTGGCLLCLNDGNGKFTLRTGSSSGLISNETLTLNGTTSSRTYIQDTISVGWHTIEMEYDGNNNWSITFDGQLKSALTYSQSSFRTCNVAWIGPSQNGSNADANTIYSELKVWDDSDTLRIDLSLDEEVLIDRVSGESPDQTSSISSIAIPIDSSDPTQDVLGGDAQHLGISFTDYS